LKHNLPLTKSCRAWAKGSPVFLAAGLLNFDVPLMGSDAIGTGDFNFGMKYLNGHPSASGSSGTAGRSMQYTQDVSLAESSDGVTFHTAEHTKELFAGISGGRYSSAKNNTAATLSRSGKGTSLDEFTITSSKGVISKFHGMHGSIATPGRLKSLTDRYGNTQTHHWESMGGKPRLSHVVDSYGRKSSFAYYDSAQDRRLKRVTDFWGRQTDLQYDDQGRLLAVVGPSITRGADSDSNIFPNGTAYVYQYDVSNPRPERRNDLIRIWYPNQVAPYLSSGRVVDVAAVYASATPRQTISYYNDPTDSFQYGKIQQLIESADGLGSVGSGAYGYIYLNSGLPGNKIDPRDPIASRTIATDRNGNQTVYDFNTNMMLVHQQVFATRGKNSLEASSWETWTKYNSHNQPLLVVHPEGNSEQYEYEDQNNTIKLNGTAYAGRIGLLKSMTRKPGNRIGVPSRPGSSGQRQLTQLYFQDPLFNETCASIEVRGNPIDNRGRFYKPQNGGTPPTLDDRSRYATISYYDYQKDKTATVKHDTALRQQLGLNATQIGRLISYVNQQMSAVLPDGFMMGIGDVNGEGTGAGTGHAARHQGCLVKTQSPWVRQLVPNPGSGNPWIWQSQQRIELYTNNARGQQTTATDSEGNLTLYIRYPENNPDGDNDVHDPHLSNHQYGRLKQMVVDADPATVMTLIGADGDMSTFIGNKIPRTNTPGVYQTLTTTHQGPSGCSSCNYDPLGNVLTTVDARGNLTNYQRNELGEVYRVTMPAPYNYQVETFYDSNRNVVRVDTQDMVVQYASSDPSDPNYAKFTPTGSGSTANVPMTAGPGGSVRPGWFSNLYEFDLLSNKIQDDMDATGSTPSSLVTGYAYDFNQNLITITKPQGNTVEYDYDERDMRIAIRVGYDPSLGVAGSVTIQAFDGNGNLLDTIGPAIRGTASQSLTAVIGDAFNGSSSQTFTGDWVSQNVYDGFDRLISSTDAAGGVTRGSYDPTDQLIASQTLGTAGGPTPTDRAGTSNVLLSASNSRYDEAGRAYENQQEVFLNTGLSGAIPTHTLPSGRSVSHQGGGLAANATANNHTATVTLTDGDTSYVLGRSVFDRTGRLSLFAADNTGQSSYTYDGANRQLSMTDALGNVQQSTYDANGNTTDTTRIDQCTISSSIATESFGSLMLYDVMNRLVQRCDQGADGSLSSSLSDPNTLFTLLGYDSRGNRTNSIDPKQNTVVNLYDGASRQLQTQQHLRTDGDGSNAIIDTVVTQQFYDANSRLITLIDDNGGTTQYLYDTLDRQVEMIFHDGSTRLYGYDAASDLTSYTDENQSLAVSTFDPLGRKTATSLTLAMGVQGTTSQSFQYDGLLRPTTALDRADSINAIVSMYYDSLSRGVEELQTYNLDTQAITHHKFQSQPPTALTYPNGRQIASGYDLLYRRSGISEGASSIAAWQFFGPRTATLGYGNGLVCSYMNNAQSRSAIQYGQPTPAWGNIGTDQLGYDGAGRLIGKRYFDSSAVMVGLTSAYDKSSNKLFERALHAESRSSLYPSYDSMNRLLEYQRGILASGGGSISIAISLPDTNQEQDYNLDGLGNWSTTTITPEGGSPLTQNRTHNKLNEVTQYNSTAVLYDHGNNSGSGASRGNGNIADDGIRTFAYDAFNRLTTVTRKSDGDTIAQYTYDALGRRIVKIVSNGGLSGSIATGTTRYLLRLLTG
jgi:YD repeat-containing protein